LIVPEAPFGLARWLNYDTVLVLTGTPVHVWRTLSSVALTVLVVHALDLFEAQRKHRVERLEQERCRAQQETLRMPSAALHAAEKGTDVLATRAARSPTCRTSTKSCWRSWREGAACSAPTRPHWACGRRMAASLR